MINLLSISPVISLGGINVALVDVIVLVVVLIAVVYGAIRGFINQILSILGGFAALILAFITCSYVADFIYLSIPSIPEGISNKIIETFGLEGVIANGSVDEIVKILNSTSIPSFLHNFIAEAIVSSGGTLQAVDVLTSWSVTVISFVSVFIISLILFAIIKKLFRTLTKIKIVGTFDKVLGLVFAVLKSLILLVVVFVVLSVITNTNVYLNPVANSGEQVKCYFNDIMISIMNSSLVKGIFKI